MAMLGEIKLFSGSYVPRGWKECNGQRVNMWDNMGLYGILGDKYGSWGEDTFALPKINPLPDSDGTGHSIYIIAVEGDYPIRD